MPASTASTPDLPAPGGDGELAWFPKGRGLAADPAVPFDEWWYA